MVERSQFEFSGDFAFPGNLESKTTNRKGPSTFARSLAMSVCRYLEPPALAVLKFRSGCSRTRCASYWIFTAPELMIFSFQLEISVYLFTSNSLVYLINRAVSGPLASSARWRR